MLLKETRTDCSDIFQTYMCTTTGDGATVITLDGDCSSTLQFPHGSYETGSEVNRSCLNGEITAGNLSRSTAMECSDDGTSDYCYYTRIVIRVTQSSRCKTLECKTVFNDGTTDVVRSFGNTTISESKLLVIYSVQCIFPGHASQSLTYSNKIIKLEICIPLCPNCINYYRPQVLCHFHMHVYLLHVSLFQINHFQGL